MSCGDGIVFRSLALAWLCSIRAVTIESTDEVYAGGIKMATPTTLPCTGKITHTWFVPKPDLIRRPVRRW